MKIDIIKECDGGFTQPSAVSGIRQDIFKKKVEEAENIIDINSKDAGSQFRDYVENVQDEINDYIDITGYDNIPYKIKVAINKFQTEFDRIVDEYSTPPREIPLYKLWKLLSVDEQNKLLSLLDNVSHLLDNGFVVNKNAKKVL